MADLQFLSDYLKSMLPFVLSSIGPHPAGVNVRQKKGTGPGDGICLTAVCQLQVAAGSAGGKLCVELPGLDCRAEKHVELSDPGSQEVCIQVMTTIIGNRVALKGPWL